jgi:hypothetical protein
MKTGIEEKVFDFLESTGLNWTVTKEPLVSGIDGKKSTSYGLFRQDPPGRETANDKLHLFTVTKTYTPLQNYEVAQALIEATESVGMKTTRGGQLNGGKNIYLQAELPDEFIGRSALKRWITGLNTHGSKSAAFGSTDTVVVCENTFYKAFGELTKFRHTASIQERVQEFVDGIKEALGQESRKIKVYKAMENTPLKESIFAGIMENVFDVKIDTKMEDVSTRQKNKLKTISEAIETEINLEGATLWGLFNGVTRYTNHVAGQKNKVKTPEELLTYLMVGEGYETNLKAYQTIHNWLVDQKIIEPEIVMVEK